MSKGFVEMYARQILAFLLKKQATYEDIINILGEINKQAYNNKKIKRS